MDHKDYFKDGVQPNLFAKTRSYRTILYNMNSTGTNNIAYGTIAEIWQEEAASSFALYQFVQSLSFAICFIIAAKITLLVMLSIISALTVVSFVFFLSMNC